MVSNIQISPKNTAQKHQREPNISKYSRAVLTGVLENFKIDCFFIRIYKPVNNNDIGRKRNLIGYLLNNFLLYILIAHYAIRIIKIADLD